jgi:hypothetical protein
LPLKEDHQDVRVGNGPVGTAPANDFLKKNFNNPFSGNGK